MAAKPWIIAENSRWMKPKSVTHRFPLSEQLLTIRIFKQQHGFGSSPGYSPPSVGAVRERIILVQLTLRLLSVEQSVDFTIYLFEC
jgi:hypothetical protein